MARIRTIKPEFWSSEQVMECAPLARLLFIGLWNFCDDAGRHAYALKQIKALIFPGDEMSFTKIDGLLQDLEAHGLIKVYEVNERRYLQVTGWHHQKIDKAQRSKHPGPNSENGRDHSRNDQGAFDLGKDQGPRTKDQGMDQGPDPSASADADGVGRSVGLTEDFRIRLRKAVEPEVENDHDFGPIEDAMSKGATEADVLEGVRRAFAARGPNGKAFRSYKVFPGWIEGVVQDRAGKRAPEPHTSSAPLGPMLALKNNCRMSEAEVIRRAREGPWMPATMGPPIGEPGCLVPQRLIDQLRSRDPPPQRATVEAA